MNAKLIGFQTGKTGKSVARSYLAALDFLMPVEASVSGIIGSENPAPTDGRLKIVRDRYLKAMEYLKSVDDTPGGNGRSKLTTYVQKQEAWSKTVESYSAAQDRAITAVKPGANAPSKEVDAARAAYLQWIQEHGRDVSSLIPAEILILTSFILVQACHSSQIHGLGCSWLQVHGKLLCPRSRANGR